MKIYILQQLHFVDQSLSGCTARLNLGQLLLISYALRRVDATLSTTMLGKQLSRVILPFSTIVILTLFSFNVNAESESDFLLANLAEEDRIQQVPGYVGTVKSQHYSGYVNVDIHHDRNLFYYFVESERDPAKDPVVLWLNGGPGCSSMDGFVYEHGPFLFSVKHNATSPEVHLEENPYAWSKAANMIFLDSPAGVGLSYSRNLEDYTTNDTQTAFDADAFLRGWFARFPQFQANPFYISGESYAGIYVPNLARQVLSNNAAGAQPPINLVGYLVGNGCTDPNFDYSALPPFAAGKSLISADMYTTMTTACEGVFWPYKTGSACETAWKALMVEVAGLNPYNILGSCDADDTPHLAHGLGALRPRANLAAVLKALGGTARWPMPGTAPVSGAVVDNWATLGRGLDAGLGYAAPCCSQLEAWLWLNNPSVRRALHARRMSDIGSWEVCSARINYTHDTGSMIKVHEYLTSQGGLRALIYSGDHDMCVPHTGSEAWTRALGRKVLSPWQQWYFSNHQVAGYMVEYEGLTYATVKGAGHMVPQTNPREALTLFQRFIDKQPLHQEATNSKVKEAVQ